MYYFLYKLINFQFYKKGFKPIRNYEQFSQVLNINLENILRTSYIFYIIVPQWKNFKYYYLLSLNRISYV